MLFTEDNKILTYNQYVLSEAIKPKVTDYGTDGMNGYFSLSDNNLYTFFIHKDKSYLFVIDKVNGEVGFSSKEGNISLNPSDYSLDSKNIHNAISVFNKVLYLITIAVKKHNLVTIMFEPANEYLGNFHKKLVNNDNFLKVLSDLGFVYHNDIKDKFIFTRK